MEQMWFEKHQPKDLTEYVFEDAEQQQFFEHIVQTRNLPNLFLVGPKGSGKTSLVNALIKSLNVSKRDVLNIDGSDTTRVEDMKNNINQFISVAPEGDFKIVFIDEADHLSPHSQAFLRHPAAKNTKYIKFILACNYEHKIIPPLVSRMIPIRIKSPNIGTITIKMANMMFAENKKFEIETLEEHIDLYYPDIRGIINSLYSHSTSGVLLPIKNKTTEFYSTLMTYLEKDDWKSARILICNNIQQDEWPELYTWLYTNLEHISKFNDVDKWQQGIITIAEYLYKHEFVADPVINVSALMITLSTI